MAQNKYGYITRNIRKIVFESTSSMSFIRNFILFYIYIYIYIYIYVQIYIYITLYICTMININTYDYHNSKIFNDYHNSKILFLFYRKIRYFRF